MEPHSDLIHWNDGFDGLNLGHVTHWHLRTNDSDPSKDCLYLYLAAPAMVKGLQDQAVATYMGAEARAIVAYLKDTSVRL